MTLKPLFVNAAVVGISLAVGLSLCEVGARLVRNPADYLSVQMVRHAVLGREVASNTTGFDEWGFRNPGVPERADVVAIGDSHTYGNTATMNDSWPLVLGRLSGQRVYNMGLGGYGPNQYFALFESRALSLKPRLIIVGLYMGDDFENAYLITYGLPHWAYLRRLPPEQVDFDIWQPPPDPTWHRQIRLWLSRHSVVYQMLVHGAIGARVRGELQIRNASRLYEGATTLSVPDKNIHEAFVPEGMARRLDQQRADVQEGMRITFALFAEMHRLANQHGIGFAVAVIPTKEMVFADYLEHDSTLAMSDTIHNLLANERVARDRVFEFFDGAGIRSVDTLPLLRQRVEQELYVRHAGDMHPSKNGYRVIAEAINDGLRLGEHARR